MATAVRLDQTHDQTEVPLIVRGAFTLAFMQAVFVIIVSIITKSLSGTVEHALTGLVVACGAAVTIFYPALKTRPLTIEGIAGAAGIGLGATFVFLFLDALVLQNFHVYTNRWREIGGGSNWWYLPVWWMVGTFLSWMGAWILANQTNKSGAPSVPGAIVLVAITTAICGAVASLTHFPPGAGWHVPTFAVAVMPGLVLANIVSAIGSKSS